MGQKIMLNGVRCAFLVLGEPERFQNKPDQKPRWDATALIPYDSPLIKQVWAAIEAAAKEKWDKKWEAYLDAIKTDMKACCFVDGKRKPDYDGYANHWALTSHRQADKGRPLCMDKDKSPIYKPDNTLYDGKAGVLYSGCFVNMQVDIFAYGGNDGKPRGIGCGLLGIQKFKDGDAFGGGAPANPDDFGEITEGADADDLS